MTEENRQIPTTGTESSEFGALADPGALTPEAPDWVGIGTAGSDLLLDETNDRLMIAEAGSLVSRDQLLEQESALEIGEISTAAVAWAAEICRSDAENRGSDAEQVLPESAAVEAAPTEDSAAALQTADWLNW